LALLHVNETVKFRVYELVTRVAGSSSEAFRHTKSAGLLDGLITDMKSDDLLVKLNAINMAAQIAMTRLGFEFLEQADELKAMASVLEIVDNEDMALVLAKCAVIKFYGRLSEAEEIDFAAVQAKYGIFYQFGRALEDRNREIVTTTVTIIGNLGSTPHGLRLLHDTDAGRRLLENFIDTYRSSAGDIKIVSLQSLATIFRVSRGTEPPEDLSKITAGIYADMGGQSTLLDSLVRNAKQPIEDLRVVSFSVMQAIAYYSWGRKEMASSGEFVGYILDRKTESDHSGKVWKFSVVQTLATGLRHDLEFNAVAVPRGVLEQFEQFVRQGPFQMLTEVAVATESM